MRTIASATGLLTAVVAVSLVLGHGAAVSVTAPTRATTAVPAVAPSNA